MTIATIEQVRAVAEYAEYAARHATNVFAPPLSFDRWTIETYGCTLEELGTS